MLSGQDGVIRRRAVRGDGDQRWRRHVLRQPGDPHLEARDLGRLPPNRGVEYFEPGDYVKQEDAPDAEPGDALLVRTGRPTAPRVHPDSPCGPDEIHGDLAAMGVNTMRLAADRDISVPGTDNLGDTFPLALPDKLTIHILAEVYLGMPLVHPVPRGRRRSSRTRRPQGNNVLRRPPARPGRYWLAGHAALHPLMAGRVCAA
jgi:hypothetical protein